eukprot:2978242-Lingulodinium_polyedra.AAC.1
MAKYCTPKCWPDLLIARGRPRPPTRLAQRRSHNFSTGAFRVLTLTRKLFVIPVEAPWKPRGSPVEA